MAGAIAAKAPISVGSKRSRRDAKARSARRVLIAITIVFLTMFVLIPLVNVFNQAFAKGIDGYIAVFFPPQPDRATRP